MYSRIHLCALLLVLAPAASADPLRLVATTPNLGSLARSIGGDTVEVTVIVKGTQDPHFIEPRPSLVRELHRADVLVLVGLELEVGWLPTLLRGARNPSIAPGGAGYVDASLVITPLDLPAPGTDRSMGDVHVRGNPHYLTDPVNGLRVAALLRDRLAALRPADRAALESRYEAFARELADRLLGPPAPGDGESGEARVRRAERGVGEAPGGWLAATRALGEPLAVEDHRFWIYFARRFGLELVGTLELRPGIAPTTRHLGEIVAMMRAREVPLILSTAYFDPSHARWVAERTGASIALLAHQPGARPDTPDYLATVGYNVDQITGVMAQRGP